MKSFEKLWWIVKSICQVNEIIRNEIAENLLENSFFLLFFNFILIKNVFFSKKKLSAFCNLEKAKYLSFMWFFYKLLRIAFF